MRRFTTPENFQHPRSHLQPNERLSATTREVDGWSVMLVRRGPGELYLTCAAQAGGRAVLTRREGDAAGWVERVVYSDNQDERLWVASAHACEGVGLTEYVGGKSPGSASCSTRMFPRKHVSG